MTVHVWAAGDRLLAGDLNDSLADPANAEGTFTPRIEGSTAAGVGTYTDQVGRYYRVGQLVYVDLRLVWTAHTGTGNVRIAGLPFAVTMSGGGNAVLGPVNTALALTAPLLLAFSGATFASLVAGAPQAAVAMVAAATINWSGVYRTAAP